MITHVFMEILEIYYLDTLFIPRHTIVAGYYRFTLIVRVSDNEWVMWLSRAVLILM